jgi:hypothetical protein
MAIGNMDTPITIIEIRKVKDKDGFAKEQEIPVACVRSRKEDKNTSEKWSNRAMFQDASALFTIRYIPNLQITTDMKIECCTGRYDIKSIENVRGRNMYIQLLAKKEVAPNGKSNNETAR